MAVLDQLVTRSQSSFAITGVAYRRNAIIYALLGSVCLAFGAWAWRTGIGWFLVPAGLVFLLGALQQSATARKYARAPM
ncbi:MAG: hypothetical protein ABR499_08000 [Gemmatimonadaceae bacterium]